MIQCAFALALGLAISACGNETTYVIDGVPQEPNVTPPIFVPEEGEDPRCVQDYNICLAYVFSKFEGKKQQPHIDKCVRELDRCRSE